MQFIKKSLGVLLSLTLAVVLYSMFNVPTAGAQMGPPAPAGPPAPNPSALTAQAVTEINVENGCFKAGKTVPITLPGSKVPIYTKIGKCVRNSIHAPLGECYWHGGQTSRPNFWECTGHMEWKTTDATFFAYKTQYAPACLNASVDRGSFKPRPFVQTIYADRRVQVFRKSNGQVGSRPLPWTCPDYRFASLR